jgi:hypothetical protein
VAQVDGESTQVGGAAPVAGVPQVEGIAQAKDGGCEAAPDADNTFLILLLQLLLKTC